MDKQILLFFAILSLSLNSVCQNIELCILKDPDGGYLNSDIDPLAFKADSEGNTYLAYYKSYDLIVSYANYFELIKYDGNGNILWMRNLLIDNEGSLPQDFSGAYINDIYVDEESVFIAGNFSTETSIQFIPFELSGAGFNNNEERSFLARLDKANGQLLWLIQDMNLGHISSATDIEVYNDKLYVSFFQDNRQELHSTNSQGLFETQGHLIVTEISKDGEIIDYISGRFAGTASIYALMDPDKASIKMGRRYAFAPKLQINSHGQMVLTCFIAKDFIYDDITVEVRECTYLHANPNCLIAHINEDLSWHFAHIPFVYLKKLRWEGLETIPRVFLDEDRNITQTFFYTMYEMGPPEINFEDGTTDTIHDGCLMKYSNNGQLLKRDLLEKHVQVKSMIPVKDGFLTFGQFEEQLSLPEIPIANGYGYSDLFIAGFNNDAQAIHIEFFGSLINDYAYLMDEVDGKVYSLGTTENRIMYNNEYIMNENDAAFVITMDTPNLSSIGDQINDNHSFIYPNPASGIVTICDVDYNSELKVIDIFGRVAFSKKINSARQLDISQLNSGTYLFQVTNKSSKLVKQQLLIIR